MKTATVISIVLLLWGCIPNDEIRIADTFSQGERDEIAAAVHDWEKALDMEIPISITSRRQANVKRWEDTDAFHRRHMDEVYALASTRHFANGDQVIIIRSGGYIAQDFGLQREEYNSKDSWERFGVRAVAKHELGHWLGFRGHDDTGLMQPIVEQPNPPIEPSHIATVCEVQLCGPGAFGEQ